MKKGLFITFEGCEGSGKTTVSKYLYNRLKDEGYDVIYSREPGGVDIAEQIRAVILNVNNTAMDPRTEALLYAASRRQHLAEVVLPALNEGKIVLCDRFVDSSLVYQGYARGIGIDKVWELNQFAIDDCMPDMTLYYDVDVEIGLARVRSRGELNRLDSENVEFHKSVRRAYQLIAEKYPERIVTVDSNQCLQTVEEESYRLLKNKIDANEQK
ncbi:MAG: dTMP kinase [Erysipelotrichaceae bacterium]|nr:dTMP kinase [Erysipelotrichaceae bacterium]